MRHDGDDPYLVVAADKGTATFCDMANDLAAEYGFWLGDAFASGGSSGYDHKGMGITARGAWESVRRHFRVLGVDADAAPITVVGIGDMSGDVFGNGMLLSQAMRLVAAFDHRHVFLDPNPDPARVVGGAQAAVRPPGLLVGRLRPRPRSPPAAASGPARPRASPLSAEVRAGAGHRGRHAHPDRAPVDHPQGARRPAVERRIGTYVKCSTEPNADVGDRANDGLRVDGIDLRARVVGEGGNLGFTQLGRVEFARQGGMINTDAIDNSAGVDCSDHEVNIKILLDAVVAAGDLTVKQRNQLLADMTDDVAEHVLADNYAQNVALANARAQAAPMVDVHAALPPQPRARGPHRPRPGVPPDREAAARAGQASGAGLTTPEFAVVLAYTKTTNVAEVLASRPARGPVPPAGAGGYFPPRAAGALRRR